MRSSRKTKKVPVKQDKQKKQKTKTKKNNQKKNNFINAQILIKYGKLFQNLMKQ